MRASLLLVALLAAFPVAAADIGTLFHSPKERQDLERQRSGTALPSGGAAIAAPVRPDPVLTGYVKRSDGKSTAFIDKQPVPVLSERFDRRLEPKVVDRWDPIPVPAPAPEATPAKADERPSGKAEEKSPGKADEKAAAKPKPEAARTRAGKPE